MVVTCAQMKAAEEALFAREETSPELLMEQAGLGCFDALRQMFPAPGRAVLFPGKGHNAGDAYVIGRHLRRSGWDVAERLLHDPATLAPLTAQKRREFLEAASPSSIPLPGSPLLALDGLLGIGARGPLRDGFATLAREMEDLRRHRGARVIAIDLPSGLDGDTGQPYPGAVVADVTLTIAAVKQGLLADAALDHVGRLALIPLPRLEPTGGNLDLLALHASWLAPLLPPPPYSRHKGAAGRAGLVAGSLAYSGAAVLASLGALRGGAGLLHLFCPRSAHSLIASRCPPEVILHPFDRLAELHEVPLDAVGIGPGLAGLDEGEVLRFVAVDTRPLVLDAEALNALARTGFSSCPGSPSAPRLLTPHPGELRRLAPDLDPSLTRFETARQFVARHPVTLLYKGARTLIAGQGNPVAHNTTGHPGLATGGVGDVLTGLLTAFLARGIPPYSAACLGSWLIGYAAELATQGSRSGPEGLAASDLPPLLPQALAALRRGAF